MTVPPDTPTALALAGLERAIYLLDRGLAPATKVRAFGRAADIVRSLDDDELIRRCGAGTMTELDGIGPSTGAVIVDSVLARRCDYLERLDAASVQQATVGAELRAALRGDLHCHSTWSDGGAPVEAMARTAMALGHDYLVITDHSPRLTIAHGLSPERLTAQLAEIADVNRRLEPFRVLTGTEVDILVDGSLDLPDEDLALLDIVVASVHSKLAMAHDEMTARLVAAVTSPHVDVLGHCTGRQIMGTARAESRFDHHAVFSACAAGHTAVEINCRPERQDPRPELLQIALDTGCLVAIDTDAHSPGQMEWQVSGCDTAARLGIDPERVINTWDSDRLLRWATDRAA